MGQWYQLRHGRISREVQPPAVAICISNARELTQSLYCNKLQPSVIITDSQGLMWQTRQRGLDTRVYKHTERYV